MSTIKEREKLLNVVITNEVLSILLMDKTTGGNIIWASNDYVNYGFNYQFDYPITIELITGDFSKVIISRVKKNDLLRINRSREKAEVFTPSWVCNCQNNQIDNAWFGKERRRFNTEKQNGWESNYYPIPFPTKDGKTWVDYVKAVRLEITCGEAPYLTSRYDTVSGKSIAVKNRIGLLDRKIRVIGENTTDSSEWIKYTIEAVKSIYGFEWQGDNLFLARKNILSTVIEFYYEKFNKVLDHNTVLTLAEIITWNLWQMDGIKMVIPQTCHDYEEVIDTFFGKEKKIKKCPGCLSGDLKKHNGTYALIKDWNENKVIRFIDILNGEN